MGVRAKICGINTVDAAEAAAANGAGFVGFVFYPPSPRHLGPDRAAEIAAALGGRVSTVGLFVDADDETIAGVLARVPLDMLQLHGGESPDRIGAVRARHGRPVMKAIAVSEAADLDRARDYDGAADWLLFDARPEPESELPGGNARAFDWHVLSGTRFSRPWMLSGGLSAANVAKAVAVTGAETVDVSSGVEDRRGHKDPDLIAAFLSAVGSC